MAEKIKVNSKITREQPDYEQALDSLTVAVITNGRPLNPIETIIANELAQNYKGEFSFCGNDETNPVFTINLEQKEHRASVSFWFKHYTDHKAVIFRAIQYSCSLNDEPAKLENWQNPKNEFPIDEFRIKKSSCTIQGDALESYIKSRVIRCVADVIPHIFKQAEKDIEELMNHWKQELDPVIIQQKKDQEAAYMKEMQKKTQAHKKKIADQRQAYIDSLTLSRGSGNYMVVRELLENYLDSFVNQWNDPLWEQHNDKIIRYINLLNRIQ